MSELRKGECIVQVATGRCAVCKNLIVKGPAVQLSAYTTRLRHLECMPKKDTRRGKIDFGGAIVIRL